LAGLKFLSSSEPPSTEKPRSHERRPITAKLLLRRAGHKNFLVGMFDLTCKGCKIEFVERPSVGERLWLKFEWLDSVEAVVRWVDGFRGGVEFEQAIHPAVFEILIAKLIAGTTWQTL
jgi:PilZ domain